MTRRIRNRDPIPYLENEGKITKSFERPKTTDWKKGLSCYDRLNMHHTLASIRRSYFFKPHKGLIPQNYLDYSLEAVYNHSSEIFPERPDYHFQKETVGEDTWRRLQNTKDLEPDRESKEYLKKVYGEGHNKIPYRYNFAHPVLISGVTERKHPSNIKLMNSSHHLPQTNAGYTRQKDDGNVFQY